MEATNKRDWLLILAGVLLVICGIVFAFSPAETLITLTIFAGAFFVVAGISDFISYARFHKTGLASGWTIFYGVLDVLLGLMFLIFPLAFAVVIPWVIGISVVIFGVYECIAAFRARKMGVSVWGWILFSGILEVLLGILFFVFPVIVALYLAIFLLIRGISLIVFGWNTAKALGN